MVPIQHLLARIQWDAEFARAEFELGYFDRVAQEVVRVSFCDLQKVDRERQVLEVADASGQLRHIPFHRIRQVFRDGQLIWSRPASRP